MEIRIRYFGMIAEKTGCYEEQFNIDNGRVTDLIALVMDKYPKLETTDFSVAQDKIIVDDTMRLNGKEIALLPPFSGG